MSNIKQYRNIMITFILSGLWHGANWTFVLWGAYHGFLNILQSIFSYEKKPPFLIRVLITFCFVNVGWVIFRANNLSELKYILSTFLYGVFTPLNYIYNGFAVLGLTNLTSLLKFIPIIVFLIIEIIAYKCDVINSTQKLFAPFRYAVYLILSYVTILWYFYYLINGVTQAFIYFQF